MSEKEVLRGEYEYHDKTYIIRIQVAEVDNTKYVPIIDWPQKGYSTAASCTANYMCSTPAEAMQKGKEVIHKVIDDLRIYRL